MAGIFAGCPGEAVGVDDSFFELGGDSLAMRVIAAINTTLNADLPVRACCASSTRNLSQYLAGRDARPTNDPRLVSVHGGNPTEVHASDLTLDRFIDADTLAPPSTCGPEPRATDGPADGRDGFPRTVSGPWCCGGWTSTAG